MKKLIVAVLLAVSLAGCSEMATVGKCLALDNTKYKCN